MNEAPSPSPSPSPLPQATNLEDVANNLEKILGRTKSSPTPEADGFVLVEEDAGLLEAAIAKIREVKQQPQPQENKGIFGRLRSALGFKGGKKTRKNRNKNKTRRNKNKTRRNKSFNQRKKRRK